MSLTSIIFLKFLHRNMVGSKTCGLHYPYSHFCFAWVSSRGGVSPRELIHACVKLNYVVFFILAWVNLRRGIYFFYTCVRELSNTWLKMSIQLDGSKTCWEKSRIHAYLGWGLYGPDPIPGTRLLPAWKPSCLLRHS